MCLTLNGFMCGCKETFVLLALDVIVQFLGVSLLSVTTKLAIVVCAGLAYLK